jgi:hypothetical protein
MPYGFLDTPWISKLLINRSTFSYLDTFQSQPAKISKNTERDIFSVLTRFMPRWQKPPALKTAAKSHRLFLGWDSLNQRSYSKAESTTV